MAWSPSSSHSLRFAYSSSPSRERPISGALTSAICISMNVSSGDPFSGRLMARGSPLSSNAEFTCPTSSRRLRIDPSPASVCQSEITTSSPLGMTSFLLGPELASSGSSPPSPSARATFRPARTMESSITIMVTVAPETISRSCADPPAAASAMRSSPAYFSVTAVIFDSGIPTSTIGSECLTRRTPVTFALSSTPISVWIGLPE